MENMSKLYIRELKYALNHRHASVLIGSGFSLNADNVNPMVSHRMPNWHELADVFCEKLGIDINDPEALKSNRYLDPLTLAEQIQTMYGRPFLDELLINQMQDDLHKPSEVHKMMLSLPWNDVFTTNYDTLLERTLPEITNKYCLVLDQNDLMHSRTDKQSRIVKLHGSFPSSRPFIITKEDYRRYPFDHAPFVNTVQQSLLENTLCLIGFSGDDPNFLSWIGWIRDNLGENTPKIFMVTNEPVDKMKEKMLITRNVEFIVLQQVYDGVKGYRELLAAFFNDLLKQDEDYRNRRSAFNWPDINHLPRYERGKEDKFLKEIRKIRQSYPGYITVPYTRLKAVDYLLDGFNEVFWRKDEPATGELDIMYEYCWFANIVCRPLFQKEINHLEAVIKRHKDEKDKTDKLKEVYFSLLYSFRLHGCNDSWENTYDNLKIYCKSEQDLLRLQYEEIMYHFYNLRMGKVEALLEAFSPPVMYPDLSLKKSCIMALFGNYEEVERILKENLSYVRKVVSKDEREINRYHSLESCIVSLHNHVYQARLASAGEPWLDSNRDKEYLTTVYEDIYIWDKENRYYSSAMTDYYERKKSYSESYSFDVGIKTETHTFSDDEDAIRAYQFVGFREITGHPFKIGNITNKHGVRGTALRLDIYNLKLPVLLYYLSGEKKIVEEVLTRVVLSTYSSKEVDELLEHCILLLQEVLENRDEKTSRGWFAQNIWEYSLITMPEIISRLMTKCSDEKFKDIFELVLKLYSSSKLSDIRGVKNLANRFMQNAPLKLILAGQEDLIQLPMTESDESHQNYPDLMGLLYRRVVALKNKHYLIRKMPETVDAYLRKLLEKFANVKCPKTIRSRLIYIFLIYEIGAENENSLKGVLWNKHNLDYDGLPEVADFLYTIICDLPHDCKERDLHDLLWKKAINDLQTIATSHAMSDCVWEIEAIKDIADRRGVSKEEIDEILPVILQACKKYTSNSTGISYGFVNEDKNLQCLGELTGVLLLDSGYCSVRKNYTNDVIQEIIKCLRDQDVPHVLLKCCVEDLKNRADIIENSLYSGSSSECQSALDTLYQFTKRKIPISPKLINTLALAFITANSIEGIDYARPLEYLIRTDKLSKEECDSVAKSLIKYDFITKIESFDDDNEIWGKKLAARKMLATLAYSLRNYYEEKNYAIPEGVIHWADIVNDTEEFVEIRRAWE